MPEKAPRSSNPKNIIEDRPGDNFYIAALKLAMNKDGLSLDEALAKFIQQATADPRSGFEHVEPMKKAAEVIRLQLKNKK